MWKLNLKLFKPILIYNKKKIALYVIFMGYVSSLIE